jgi:hypothetical protein
LILLTTSAIDLLENPNLKGDRKTCSDVQGNTIDCETQSLSIALSHKLELDFSHLVDQIDDEADVSANLEFRDL